MLHEDSPENFTKLIRWNANAQQAVRLIVTANTSMILFLQYAPMEKQIFFASGMIKKIA